MTNFTRALVGTTALALLGAPLPALAHVTLEAASATANSTYKAVLRVPHGCDGAATHTVTMTIPEGYFGVKPMPKAGWTLETVQGDYEKVYTLHGDDVSSGVTEVRWSDGDLPDAFYDEFVVRGSLTDFAPGTVLPFKVVQTCADGAVAWDEIAAPGGDRHDLARPAPTLTIAEAASGSAGHGGRGGHGGHGDEASAAGPIDVEAAWMRQPPPGADVAGAYLTIRNDGDEADRLLGGSVAFADRFEVHEMAMDQGMMQMREVEGGLEIPAGETVELTPGSYHIMMIGLSGAPKAGDTVPATLTFERAGDVEIELSVASMGASKAPEHDHGAMHPKAD